MQLPSSARPRSFRRSQLCGATAPAGGVSGAGSSGRAARQSVSSVWAAFVPFVQLVLQSVILVLDAHRGRICERGGIRSPWARGRVAIHVSTSRSDHRTALRPTRNGTGNSPARTLRYRSDLFKPVQCSTWARVRNLSFFFGMRDMPAAFPFRLSVGGGALKHAANNSGVRPARQAARRTADAELARPRAVQ